MDKIINLLINNWTKGVDTYTHNGSTWLIFTEQKSWVIELTESKSLWYNYNFFRELFSLTSMDVVENQHYITKWVEDNIINKVNYTSWGSTMNEFVGDVIEDGVKVIEPVEHTRNAAEHTRNAATKDTIKYGVKHTEVGWHQCNNIDDTIERGIKETHDDAHNHKDRINGVIKNGVKETKYNQTLQDPKFKEVLKNGVIMSNPRQYVTKKILDDTIQNGVKETKTPGKDGDILSTIEWMEINNTKNVPQMIDDIIDNGEKINGTFVGGNRQKENVESVIGYGTKNPSV